jgi:hypothetical protein
MDISRAASKCKCDACIGCVEHLELVVGSRYVVRVPNDLDDMSVATHFAVECMAGIHDRTAHGQLCITREASV